MSTIYKNLKVQLLNNNIVRFEYCPNGEFSDQESLFVPGVKASNLEIKSDSENTVCFSIGNFVFNFNENSPLETLTVSLNNNVVYRYHEIANSGELPMPNKTPFVFALMDSPRLLIPADGYVKNNEGFILQKDVKDLYLLLCNKDYILLRKQFIALTGKNQLPRIKNFGLFSSRYYKYSQKTAMEMIKTYEKHKIPLDTFILDTDWRNSDDLDGCGYNVNEKLFPNIEDFFRFAHSKNIQVMMNDHPLPLNADSKVLDEEEIKYRQTNLTKLYIKGLDGWWYDRNWTCKLNSVDGKIASESLGNYIFNDVTKQFNLGFTLDPEVYSRNLVMSNINNIRNGIYKEMLDSTSHKYSLQWSGDVPSNEHSLRNEIINLNKCANNMLAFYSSDIGGHCDNPTKTQYTRWFEYGAFSPVLRPHCTNTVKKYREPWNYDRKTLEICRDYLNIRLRLLNVFYTAAYKNVDSGLGVCAPLYLQNPNDKKCYKEATSFMVGDSILVSPISGASRDKSLNKACFADSFKVYIYPNETFSGKAYSKNIKSFNDVEKFFKSVKAKNKKAKKFSFRYKGTLKLNQDYELGLKHEVAAKVILDKKVVFNDLAGQWFEYNDLGKVRKNKKTSLIVETIQTRKLKPIDIVYYKLFKNNKTRIYLPEGEWYNMFHRNVYQGKRYIKERFKINETPVFVKAGSLLALYKTTDNISNMSLKNIVYDYYPSKKVTKSDYFYEDDGVSTGYLIGEYRKNSYKTGFKDDRYIVTLDGNEKLLDDGIRVRNVIFKVHVRDNETIDQVLINGEPIKFKRHDHARRVVPFLDNEFAKDSKTLAFKFRQNLKDNYKIELIVREK